MKSAVINYHTSGDSVRQRPMEILREKRMQLVPCQCHWSVVASCGDIYLATFFKGEVRNMTCTFPTTALFSFMLAAIYRIDCKMIFNKCNITLVQRKARTRQPYRRSRTKNPSWNEKQGPRQPKYVLKGLQQSKKISYDSVTAYLNIQCK